MVSLTAKIRLICNRQYPIIPHLSRESTRGTLQVILIHHREACTQYRDSLTTSNILVSHFLNMRVQQFLSTQKIRVT